MPLSWQRLMRCHRSHIYIAKPFLKPLWWKVSKLSIALAISLLSIEGIKRRNVTASLLLSHQGKQQILTTQRHLLYGVLCGIPAEVQYLSHNKMGWSWTVQQLRCRHMYTDWVFFRFILINGPCLYKLKRANRGLWLYSEIERRKKITVSRWYDTSVFL